jgi:hypothetical protein
VGGSTYCNTRVDLEVLLPALAKARGKIMDELREQVEKGKVSKRLRPFGKLLLRWYDISKEARACVERAEGVSVAKAKEYLIAQSREYYGKYIDAVLGSELGAEYPDTWDYLTPK